MQTKRLAKVQIAIGAGKGGVGKSMLTAQIAAFLVAKGYKVGLLDADLYGPSQPTMLKVDRPASISKQKRDGVEYEQIIPARSRGIAYVSLGLFRSQGAAVAARAPISNGLIKNFLNQVQWESGGGKLDVLLIDLPPGTGDIQLSVAQQICCDAACLVSTPQKVCLEDVRRAKDLFSQLKIPLLGFVFNMSYMEINGKTHFPFGRADNELWENLLATKCLGQIPLDPNLSLFADQGQTLVAAESKQNTHSSAYQALELISGFFEKLLQTVEKTSDHSFSLTLKSKTQSVFFGEEHPFLKSVSLNSAGQIFIQSRDREELLLDPMQLLQECPCAQCAAKRNAKNKEQCERVTPVFQGVESVGNYAMRVITRGGCSLGIFPFTDLYQNSSGDNFSFKNNFSAEFVRNHTSEVGSQHNA